MRYKSLKFLFTAVHPPVSLTIRAPELPGRKPPPVMSSKSTEDRTNTSPVNPLENHFISGSDSNLTQQRRSNRKTSEGQFPLPPRPLVGKKPTLPPGRKVSPSGGAPPPLPPLPHENPESPQSEQNGSILPLSDLDSARRRLKKVTPPSSSSPKFSDSNRSFGYQPPNDMLSQSNHVQLRKLRSRSPPLPPPPENETVPNYCNIIVPPLPPLPPPPSSVSPPVSPPPLPSLPVQACKRPPPPPFAGPKLLTSPTTSSVASPSKDGSPRFPNSQNLVNKVTFELS